jgi:hypothetical protein
MEKHQFAVAQFGKCLDPPLIFLISLKLIFVCFGHLKLSWGFFVLYLFRCISFPVKIYILLKILLPPPCGEQELTGFTWLTEEVQQKLSEMKCMLPEMKCNGKDKVQKSPNSVLNVQNKQKSISRRRLKLEFEQDLYF